MKRDEKQKTDFDKKASSWDDNPIPVKLAADIAQCIASEIPLNSTMDVLDFGCGTGLLALHLRPRVSSIVGFDSSLGMLEVLKKKIAAEGLENVYPYFLDLEKGERLKGQYQLIITSMTLHHIKNFLPLLTQMYEALQPDGYLCIADLDLEQGKFHDTNDGIFHFGFDRKVLRRYLEEAGFEDIRVVQGAEIVKAGNDGLVRPFSVFLMVGRKKGILG